MRSGEVQLSEILTIGRSLPTEPAGQIVVVFALRRDSLYDLGSEFLGGYLGWVSSLVSRRFAADCGIVRTVVVADIVPPSPVSPATAVMPGGSPITTWPGCARVDVPRVL